LAFLAEELLHLSGFPCLIVGFFDFIYFLENIFFFFQVAQIELLYEFLALLLGLLLLLFLFILLAFVLLLSLFDLIFLLFEVLLDSYFVVFFLSSDLVLFLGFQFHENFLLFGYFGFDFLEFLKFLAICLIFPFLFGFLLEVLLLFFLLLRLLALLPQGFYFELD
jgi:hypothetical protein